MTTRCDYCGRPFADTDAELVARAIARAVKTRGLVGGLLLWPRIVRLVWRARRVR